MTEQRRERDAFIAAAADYCDLYEHAEHVGAEDFFLRLARVLPRLQAAALELTYPDEELPDDEIATDQVWDSQGGVGAILATVDWDTVADHAYSTARRRWFRRVPSPPVEVFLHDDLGDLYSDLKRGFLLLEAGRPEAEAVFHWRLTFWSHWGYHNADAMRIVHYYVALYLGG